MITQSRLEVRGAQPTWRRPGGFDDGSKRQPDEGVAYKSQTCFVKTPGPSTRKSGGDVRRHFTALFSHHLLFPLILLLPPSDPPSQDAAVDRSPARAARKACRSGAHKGQTSGMASGFVQANFVAMPKEYA